MSKKLATGLRAEGSALNFGKHPKRSASPEIRGWADLVFAWELYLVSCA